MKLPVLLRAALLALAICLARGGDLVSQMNDRAAIERVYHAHRLGTPPPFEQAMPRELIEKVVRQDLHKEAVLRKGYGLEITPKMIAAEVERIDSTTHAPEILAEIKHALDDDPERFALSMARPIVVERTLRGRFDNDDKIHAPQRREAERARETALAAKKNGVKKQIAALSAGKAGAVTESAWQLTARSEGEKVEIRGQAPAIKTVTNSNAYSMEATAQVAQVLNSPLSERDRKLYFEDLDPELQKVLRVQLQKPGDVSAVIETPGGFLLFIAKERSSETLSAASFSISKRSYEQWIEEQEIN